VIGILLLLLLLDDNNDDAVVPICFFVRYRERERARERKGLDVM